MQGLQGSLLRLWPASANDQRSQSAHPPTASPPHTEIHAMREAAVIPSCPDRAPNALNRNPMLEIGPWLPRPTAFPRTCFEGCQRTNRSRLGIERIPVPAHECHRPSELVLEVLKALLANPPLSLATPSNHQIALSDNAAIRRRPPRTLCLLFESHLTELAVAMTPRHVVARPPASHPRSLGTRGCRQAAEWRNSPRPPPRGMVTSMLSTPLDWAA